MDEKKKFDKLAKKFFDTLVERNPIMGTYFGLHKYDTLMPDESRKIYLEEIKILEKFKKEFGKIDLKKIDFDRQIDLELAFHEIDLALFELKDLRQWEKNPDVANEIGDALFLLFSREFATIKNRMKSILSRIERIPKVYKQTKTRIKKPVRKWVEIAIESCERLPSFLNEIVKTAENEKLDLKFSRRLRKAVDEVKRENESYKNYLKKLLPKASEEFAIGREKFDKLVRLRKLGISTDEILKLGEKYLEQLKKRREEIATHIKPEATVEEVKKIIEEKHPENFDKVLEAYRDSIKGAREFVVKKNVASIPKNEILKVIETPVYMRHFIPFAAYFPPAKFDKIQQGIYIVTRAESGSLKRYNLPDIHNTSVHEGYPGHHLQLSSSNTNKSWIRLLDHATEFVEGWAHYCEEYMREIGYDDSLEYSFIQTNDMIWRAARIIVDIKLSVGEMSFDEAVKFLMENASMDKEGAVGEVKRYTSSPSYQLSYLLGKHLIKEMKRELKRKFGKKFSDKKFHDILLYSGSLPIYFHKKILQAKFSSK